MTTMAGWMDFATRGVYLFDAAAPPGRVLQFDGRLDNRDDLLLRLGARAETTDREIVEAALVRWGAESLAAIVGDWSLVTWDSTTRTLGLARDYMGARPLYFHAGPQAVAWSSDLGELVDRCGQRDALSDVFAASFMSLRPLAPLTPYIGIHPVAPGTCVTVRADGTIRTRRYWTLEPGEIRYRQKRQYEEELRRIWCEAIRTRLAAPGTIWAELSGGLDSSAVVCAADHLITRGLVCTRALRLVSHATLQSPEGDERRFIAEVERQVRVHSEIVGVEEHQGRIDPAHAWITPYALHGVGLAMVNRVRAAGGTVVLSGRLGDAVMGCQPDNSSAVFDDLRSGHLRSALRNLRGWSRSTRRPFIELAWRLFAPSTPIADSGAGLLVERLRRLLLDMPRIDEVGGVPRSKRALARMVLGYACGGRLDIPHRPTDVLYTYPFAHRPLVDFMLAIPGEELSAPGATRALMRRAFCGLVPARILQRQSKGYYPPAAFRAARRHAASILDVHALEVVERGWIDPGRLRESLRSFIDGSGETGVDIHRVLRLERWLDARRDQRPNPQRKEVNTHAVLDA